MKRLVVEFEPGSDFEDNDMTELCDRLFDLVNEFGGNEVRVKEDN